MMTEFEGLVRAFRESVDAAYTAASWALGSFACIDAANAVWIARAGHAGIPRHVDLLRDGSAYAKLLAAQTLAKLAWRDHANQVLIAEAGGIPPLVDLLRDASAKAKLSAAVALRTLASSNDANAVAIAKAGGIPPLVDLLRGGSAEAKAEATRVLGHLACNARPGAAASRVLIAEAGSVPPLVDLLRNGSADAKPLAAWALHYLAYNNDTNIVAIAAAVGLESLVQLARRGRATVDNIDILVVSNAALPAKRKAALVVAALLRACVPDEVRGRADVRDVIRDVIGPYL